MSHEDHLEPIRNMTHLERNPPQAYQTVQALPDNDPRNLEEEVRPTHTAEIGTLKKLAVPGGTAWLGSSSGVYFVNTVRRAFSAAFAEAAKKRHADNAVPASEDIIAGDGELQSDACNNITQQDSVLSRGLTANFASVVGVVPLDKRLTANLVTQYFRQTHPLFPFLHGPQFLQDLDHVYSTVIPKIKAKQTLTSNESVQVIILQIIINIACLDQEIGKKDYLPEESWIKCSRGLLGLVLPLCTQSPPQLSTVQLFLAAELYLTLTSSLRHASTLAGVVLRLIYHSGLHRCPLRYASLTAADCEIRKRVFWTAYALDRHLSLALGDPPGVQDSDIDVCLSRGLGGDMEGELHRAVSRNALSKEELDSGEEIRLHQPRDPRTGQVVTGDPDFTFRAVQQAYSITEGFDSQPKREAESTLTGKRLREAILTAYVHYGKLTGRIIEIFHKSINFRFPEQDEIGYLVADIDDWWNDLPSTLTADSGGNIKSYPDAYQSLVEQHKMYGPFFSLLYNQLLLLINRPKLSLDQKSADFHQGLQACIRASRNTLNALARHRDNRQSMFLPGLQSAAWMSGLIIAFSCQLGKYPKNRACDDLRACLDILETMNMKQYTVKNCHKVLLLLLTDIRARTTNSNGALYDKDICSDYRSTAQKRHRESTAADSNPQKKRSWTRTTASDVSSRDQPEDQSYSARDMDGSQSTSSTPNLIRAQSISAEISATNLTSDRIGAAIYENPRDMVYAQNNHNINFAEPPDMNTDALWTDFDNNAFDIFGSVSWENMTGAEFIDWSLPMNDINVNDNEIHPKASGQYG